MIYGRRADSVLPVSATSYILKLHDRKNIFVEIHVVLGTSVIYFRQEVQSKICHVNSSHSLRDKLCPAVAPTASCKA